MPTKTSDSIPSLKKQIDNLKREVVSYRKQIKSLEADNRRLLKDCTMLQRAWRMAMQENEQSCR